MRDYETIRSLCYDIKMLPWHQRFTHRGEEKGVDLTPEEYERIASGARLFKPIGADHAKFDKDGVTLRCYGVLITCTAAQSGPSLASIVGQTKETV